MDKCILVPSAESDLLEAMVDRHGLKEVLNALADICGAKAAHIAENWQDTGLAKAWEKNADKLARVPLIDTRSSFSKGIPVR